MPELGWALFGEIAMPSKPCIFTSLRTQLLLSKQSWPAYTQEPLPAHTLLGADAITKCCFLPQYPFCCLAPPHQSPSQHMPHPPVTGLEQLGGDAPHAAQAQQVVQAMCGPGGKAGACIAPQAGDSVLGWESLFSPVLPGCAAARVPPAGRLWRFRECSPWGYDLACMPGPDQRIGDTHHLPAVARGWFGTVPL